MTGSPLSPRFVHFGAGVAGAFLFFVGAVFSFPPSPFVPYPPNPLPAGLLGVGLLVVLATAIEVRHSRAPMATPSLGEGDDSQGPEEPDEADPSADHPAAAEPWDEDAVGSPDPPRYLPMLLALEPRREVETSSIPGALAASEWDESNEFVPDLPIPHSTVAAALPFSAAMQVSSDGGREPRRTVGSFHREVSRLRTALTGSGPFHSDTFDYSRSGGKQSSIPEPPPLRETPASRHRSCTACGAGLGGRGTDPLCDGCGRPLCSGCYWRPGSGPGMHRCLGCAARTDLGPVRVTLARASPGPTAPRDLS